MEYKSKIKSSDDLDIGNFVQGIWRLCHLHVFPSLFCKFLGKFLLYFLLFFFQLFLFFLSCLSLLACLVSIPLFCSWFYLAQRLWKLFKILCFFFIFVFIFLFFLSWWWLADFIQVAWNYGCSLPVLNDVFLITFAFVRQLLVQINFLLCMFFKSFSHYVIFLQR